MHLLHILLFCLYTFLCCLFIKKSKRFAHPVIAKNIFLGIFLTRLLAGFVYAYIYSLHPYNLHSDTWSVFRSSLAEYHILLKDPLKFIRTTFVFEGDISYTNFTQSGSSYWNILKEVLLVKFEALLDLLSFGNYYVNLVLFTLLMLLGSNFLFKTFERIFANRHDLNLALAFLVPSTVFWTSAIYKDGILFVLMAIVVYETMRQMNGERPLVRYLSAIGLSLIALFLLRTYVALLMIPALSGWIIAEKTRRNPIVIFSCIYVAALISAMLAKLIYPAFDIPLLLASWQEAFLASPANSAMTANRLQPSFPGLLKNLPQSLNFAFLRPLLWENKGKQYLLFALELLLMQVLFVFTIVRRPHLERKQLNFTVFCFCLAFTGCLFLGYTVHIIGALVRYRSIFLPFMFAALTANLKNLTSNSKSQTQNQP